MFVYGSYFSGWPSGSISSFGLQFALAAGAIVIVTSSSDDKLQIASKLGAQHVINYKKTPKWDEEVMRIVSIRVCYNNALHLLGEPNLQTDGVGVDHVLEVSILHFYLCYLRSC
jgi:NADPH:quinone reductase-like Zn-dependent oxidoreductase